MGGLNPQIPASKENNTSKGLSSSAVVVPVTTAGVSNANRQDSISVPSGMSSNPVPLPTVQKTISSSDVVLQISNSVAVPKVSNQVCTAEVTPNETNHLSGLTEERVSVLPDVQDESTATATTTAERPAVTPPLLDYFNADLMLKEYNLRQAKGATPIDGLPANKLKDTAGVKNHDSSAERGRCGKHERQLESEVSLESKKAKLDAAKASEELSKSSSSSSVGDELSRNSLQSSISESQNVLNGAVHDKKGRTKQSLRRKGIVQRRKSQSHKRPQPARMDTVVDGENKADFLCAFCHQRDGALNLGFLYGPYKLNAVSVNPSGKEDPQICKDGSKDFIVDNPKELWVHEDCVVWAPGVCLVGDQLIGLQEATIDGDKMVVICVLW